MEEWSSLHNSTGSTRNIRKDVVTILLFWLVGRMHPHTLDGQGFVSQPRWNGKRQLVVLTDVFIHGEMNGMERNAIMLSGLRDNLYLHTIDI